MQQHTAGVATLVLTTASVLPGSSRAAQCQHSNSVPSAAQLQSQLLWHAMLKRLPCVGSAGARAHGSALGPSHEAVPCPQLLFLQERRPGQQVFEFDICFTPWHFTPKNARRLCDQQLRGFVRKDAL